MGEIIPVVAVIYDAGWDEGLAGAGGLCGVRGCLKTAWPSVVLGLVVVLVLDLAGFDYDYEDDDEGDVAGPEFSNML